MKTSKIERVLMAMIGVLFLALAAVVADTLRDRVIHVGDTAPEFSVQTNAGLTVSRSNFGGRLLVLNFWATWCAPCVREMSSLDQFQKQLKGDGVVVLGINVDEEEESYRAFLKRTGLSFLTAHDPAAKISSEFGTYRYPETYLIDARGKVLQKIIGPTDWADPRMISYVKSLL